MSIRIPSRISLNVHVAPVQVHLWREHEQLLKVFCLLASTSNTSLSSSLYMSLTSNMYAIMGGQP